LFIKIYLGDFGIASQLTTVTCKKVSVVGTPYFMAPEVFFFVNYYFGALPLAIDLIIISRLHCTLQDTIRRYLTCKNRKTKEEINNI
jgi:serine/threonine protein kinase